MLQNGDIPDQTSDEMVYINLPYFPNLYVYQDLKTGMHVESFVTFIFSYYFDTQNLSTL